MGRENLHCATPFDTVFTMKKLSAVGSILLAIGAVSLGACGDSDSDDGGSAGSAGMTGSAGAPGTGGSAGMTGGMCDGASLCGRSLGECAVTTITMSECLDFYGPMSTCADVAAYTACNCTCDADNPTCTAWFSCGETCFNDHC